MFYPIRDIQILRSQPVIQLHKQIAIHEGKASEMLGYGNTVQEHNKTSQTMKWISKRKWKEKKRLSSDFTRQQHNSSSQTIPQWPRCARSTIWVVHCIFFAAHRSRAAYSDTCPLPYLRQELYFNLDTALSTCRPHLPLDSKPWYILTDYVDQFKRPRSMWEIIHLP